jgi:hypothetical protein
MIEPPKGTESVPRQGASTDSVKRKSEIGPPIAIGVMLVGIGFVAHERLDQLAARLKRMRRD